MPSKHHKTKSVVALKKIEQKNQNSSCLFRMSSTITFLSIIFLLIYLYGRDKIKKSLPNEICLITLECATNLRCIDNACKCDLNEIYHNKCIKAISFGRKCNISITNHCEKNFVCHQDNSLCNCSDEHYLLDHLCKEKNRYNASCKNNFECITNFCNETCKCSKE